MSNSIHQVDCSRIAEFCFADAPAAFQEHQALFMDAVMAVNGIDWSTREFSPSSNLRVAPLGVPVRFLGHLVSMSEAYTPEALVQDVLPVVDLAFKPKGGGNLECVPLPARDGALKLLCHLQKRELLEITGCFVQLPHKLRKRWQLVRRFQLVAAKPVNAHMIRVQATSEERKAAQEVVSGAGDLFAHIRTQLIDQLGIRGQDAAPELALALDAMILQALSDGNVGNHAGRLHTMVIGSPGVGKKLLTRAAALLNPAFTEVQPSKCTVAGIQSATVLINQAYVAEPGLIPLADQGVCAFQDFHAVKDKDGVLGVLNMVMEDGVLIDGSASKATIQARTGIHVDLNRQSHLDPGRITISGILDLGLQLHNLSRFDSIIEIPRDADRQEQVSEAMTRRSVRVGASAANPTSHRELQVLVAHLRDKTPVVDVPAKVGHQIAQMMTELRGDFDHPLLGDFTVRMVNSAYKLICAHARLAQRRRATVEDVHAVRPLLAAKIDFIRELVTTLPAMRAETGLRHNLSRQRWLRSHFAGQDVTLQVASQALKNAGENTLNDRTIRRDLDAIGSKSKHGAWHVNA